MSVNLTVDETTPPVVMTDLMQERSNLDGAEDWAKRRIWEKVGKTVWMRKKINI